MDLIADHHEMPLISRLPGEVSIMKCSAAGLQAKKPDKCLAVSPFLFMAGLFLQAVFVFLPSPPFRLQDLSAPTYSSLLLTRLVVSLVL
jgi:hypothetical protein